MRDRHPLAHPLLALLAGAIFVVSVIGAVLTSRDSAPEVAQPTTTVAQSTPPATSASFAEFGQTMLRVIKPDGVPADACALLAETDQQRAQGLMRQSDFGGYAAMVFRFPSNSDSSFYMANVTIPLSIAWFDEVGAFVSQTGMQPCTTEVSQCALYPAAGQYRCAIEVPLGGLDELGIGPGSTIAVGGNCP